MSRSFLLCLFFILTGCVSLPSGFVRLDNHTPSGIDEVINRIEDNRVIFVGEIHGTPGIHLLQLEVIKRLHESGRQVSIAMEAFPAGKQHIFDDWLSGGLHEADFERLYRDTWAVPYDYYRQILQYAREQKIPLLAINAENPMIASVSKNGLDLLPEEFLKEVGFTACSANPLYKQILGSTFHASSFPHLCDGQRLRDSIMASNIAKALKENNRTIVVLAGATHAMKPAVPAILSGLTEAKIIVLLPGSIERVIKKPPDRDIADYIWEE